MIPLTFHPEARGFNADSALKKFKSLTQNEDKSPFSIEQLANRAFFLQEVAVIYAYANDTVAPKQGTEDIQVPSNVLEGQWEYDNTRKIYVRTDMSSKNLAFVRRSDNDGLGDWVYVTMPRDLSKESLEPRGFFDFQNTLSISFKHMQEAIETVKRYELAIKGYICIAKSRQYSE